MQPFFLFKGHNDDYDREQLRRGARLAQDFLDAILVHWTTAQLVNVTHKAATLALPSGQTFTVTADQIAAPADFEHDWMQGAARHVANEWGGAFALGFVPNADRETRLWARAYAETYNLKLIDCNDCMQGGKLTAAELARLPDMVAEVKGRQNAPAVPGARDAITQPRAALPAPAPA